MKMLIECAHCGIVLEADVPMALSLMMKKPLEKFVDVLVDKVKEVAER